MFSMPKESPRFQSQSTLLFTPSDGQPGGPLVAPEQDARWVEGLVSAVLEPMQHRCAGRVWVANIDRRGQAECAFCVVRSERVGPAPSALPSQALVARVRRDLRRFKGSKGWVWLSPWADPFVPSARDLSGPALQVAEELLRAGQDLVVKTRGGLQDAAGLVTMARRHPGRVKVEIPCFAADPELVAAWERGTAPLHDRLALAQALQSAGAEVVASIGPLVPLVNDSASALSALGKRLRQAGVLVWHPTWIRYAQGLIPQVRREVSRSRARILEGWFHMGRGPGASVPELPERVRKTLLGRLHEVADRQGAQLLVCTCTSHLGRAACLSGPVGGREREQLDLFA